LLKSVEDISTTKKRVRIEISSEEIEREIGSSLENLRQKVKIPGFRPGKSPLHLIEKRYGKAVESEVLEKVIPEHYNAALREADLNPVTMPELEEKIDFKRNNPLDLSFIIEVLPKIENLQYENIPVKDIPVTVEDADVEETIKRLQNQKATYEVSQDEVAMDDMVSFDHADSEIIEGEKVPVLKEIISTMGNEIFPPDVMELSLGKKKDDIIEFTKTFDESVKQKELKGKTARIKLAIKEIKKKNLPAIDDEFAKDLGFGDLSELREKLKEKLHAAKTDQIKRLQKAAIVTGLIESINPAVPDLLVTREMEVLSMEKSASGQQEDSIATDSVSEILEIASETTEKARQEQDEAVQAQEMVKDEESKMRQKAFRNVQAAHIIDAIGKKEGIFVTDAELDQRISLLAQRLSATPEAVKSFYTYKEGSLDSLRHSIYEDKVLDFLLSKAVIEKEENQ
jgi:trigger factor